MAASDKFIHGDYLEQNNIYDLFRHCMDRLVIEKPQDPLSFLIQLLQHPPTLNVICFQPPGLQASNNSPVDQCASKYNLIHVSLQHVLQHVLQHTQQYQLNETDKSMIQELTQGHPHGQHAAQEDKYQTLVSNLVIQRLQQSDCKSQGWILSDFPATTSQALALQRSGCVPNKLIYIDHEVDNIRFFCISGLRITAESANTLIMEWKKKMDAVVDFYKDSIHYIDGRQGIAHVIDNSLQYLSSPVHGLGSRVPHRICVVGPLGSGRSTQSLMLARALNIVHISTSALLQSLAHGDSPAAQEAKYALQTGQPAPDEVIIELLKNRLSQADARNGFVLDGFPRTVQQAQALFDLKVQPSRTILLDAPDAAIEKRLTSLLHDPKSGELHSADQVDEVQKLSLIPVDVPKAKFSKIAQLNFRSNIDGVKSVLKNSLKSFDAMQSKQALHAQIKDFVLYPLSQ